eukprot:SAG11_NODE_2241_length_3644_cov_4.619182_1_plen_72_part_00
MVTLLSQSSVILALSLVRHFVALAEADACSSSLLALAFLTVSPCVQRIDGVELAARVDASIDGVDDATAAK